jgi:hypothetical protein
MGLDVEHIETETSIPDLPVAGGLEAMSGRFISHRVYAHFETGLFC